NSASNNDTTPFYPAAHHLPNELAVAASDSAGNLASFSNYGPTTVDLAAPGVNVLSTVQVNRGSYAYASGTSMAAPHVTGVAALVAGLDPAWTPQQVIADIKAGVRPVAGLVGKVATGGLLNAYNAVASAQTSPSYSLFGPSAVPAEPARAGGGTYELG